MYEVRPRVVSGIRDFDIIEAKNIRRSCHLIPKFGVGEKVDRASSSETALDDNQKFWLNNYVDKAAYRSIF
jgi:hypothetical protein